MGILSYLGFGKRGGAIPLGIASPWQDGALAQILVRELIGADVAAGLPLDRATAMTIPAVSKARNLLVATIAPKPLVALTGNVRVANQPAWMYRTNTNVTPYERMAWTVDDLIFYGYSLWKVTRGEAGAILEAEWVPTSQWSLDEKNRITINDVVQDEKAVILFNSPFEGLLTVGRHTLKGARDQEAAWVGRAKNPVPIIELHVTEEYEGKPEDIKKYVDAWALARTQENGAIGFTPKGLEIKTHGEVKADLMVEGRNAVRTDVGSFVNIRASMLDGTAGIDSLTYSTTAGEKNSFYEFDLPFWTDPITSRLSLDDVVARGQRSAFDFYEAYSATPNPTGSPTED